MQPSYLAFQQTTTPSRFEAAITRFASFPTADKSMQNQKIEEWKLHSGRQNIKFTCGWSDYFTLTKLTGRKVGIF